MKKQQKSSRQESVKKPRSLIFIIGLLVLGILLFFFFGTETVVKPGNGILAIPIDRYDFGNVAVSTGAVSKTLTLANVGEEDLIITFLDSSCGCTSARVINNGEKGPIFGMSSHGKSPTDWQTVIEPGGKATLKIYYDPLVHKHFRGEASRVVTITTNSVTTPEKKVRIKVNQID